MTMKAKINYENGMNKKAVYFHSMGKNDEFLAKACHRLNIGQALYICRNRLTYWSNPGIAVGTLPPQENLALALVDLNFCHHSNHIIAALVASIAELKATPSPRLFR